MRALVYDTFGGPFEVREVPAPTAPPGGVLVRVEATGVCRSDRHAWQGHDPGVRLPHVPGHELAGTVQEVGEGVLRWRGGERVTVPFVCACGRCPTCLAGHQQVCERQTQPGFTHWGSFAELVALAAADVNLVALPDDLPAVAAASLGCRYATAFRAVVHQGRVRAGEWVAVHGCGGVGSSAVQVAVAAGARVVAVDVSPDALELARRLGAEHVVRSASDPPAAAAADSDAAGDSVASAGSPADIAAAVSPAGTAADVVRQLTGGGAHLSLDALGSAATCAGSVACLRPRGRHVQVGLLPPGPSAVPMDRVVALELEVLGSHGMPAHAYPELLALVSASRLRPQDLVTRELALPEAGRALREVGRRPGIAVVTEF